MKRRLYKKKWEWDK